MKGQGRIISVSKPEFVEKILNGTKVTTIRPTFEHRKIPYKEELHGSCCYGEVMSVNGKVTTRKYAGEITKIKKPIHKVGDIVQLSFKSRSRYKFFCKLCGLPCERDESFKSGNYGKCKCRIEMDKEFEDIDKQFASIGIVCDSPPIKSISPLIPRGVFARARITKVEEIGMEKSKDILTKQEGFSICIKTADNEDNIFIDSCGCNKIIAKRDGFDSVEEFFKFFDSHYDLSEPKKFTRYTFEVIRDENR